MGSDGARGLLAMRQAGALTMVQDDESCVVAGMPRAARAMGGARLVLSIPDMAARLCSVCDGAVG